MKGLVGYGDLDFFLDFDGVLDHAMCCGARVGAYLSVPESQVLFQHAALLDLKKRRL